MYSRPNFASTSNCSFESMRIVCVPSCARSRSTRSTRLRSWCSKVPGGDLKPRSRTAAPGLAQVGDVVGELGVGGLGGVRAQDEAAAFGRGALARLRQRVHARAQLLAQLLRADLLRDADVVVLRQEDQQAPGDADLRRQARALVPIGSLMTCTIRVWPSKTRRSIGVCGAPLRACSALA